jgi:uncharacterized DUF497 family protein
MDVGYVWDEDKYERVQDKHGVRFAEVVDVFEDRRAIHGPDPGGNLNRRMVVGKTRGGRVLQIIYTDEDAPLARIITAFDASQEWRDEYFD